MFTRKLLVAAVLALASGITVAQHAPATGASSPAKKSTKPVTRKAAKAVKREPTPEERIQQGKADGGGTPRQRARIKKMQDQANHDIEAKKHP